MRTSTHGGGHGCHADAGRPPCGVGPLRPPQRRMPTVHISRDETQGAYHQGMILGQYIHGDMRV